MTSRTAHFDSSSRRLPSPITPFCVTWCNAGSKWPATVALALVDVTTVRGPPPLASGPHIVRAGGGGGAAERGPVLLDGYYFLTAACTLIGAAWWWWFRRRLRHIEALPLAAWAVEGLGLLLAA